MRDSRSAVVLLGVWFGIAVGVRWRRQSDPRRRRPPRPRQRRWSSRPSPMAIRCASPSRCLARPVVRLLNIDAPELEAPHRSHGRESRATVSPTSSPWARLSPSRPMSCASTFSAVCSRMSPRARPASMPTASSCGAGRRCCSSSGRMWPASRTIAARKSRRNAPAAASGSPAARCPSCPSSIRRRNNTEALARPVGDFFTRRFVEAADYRVVPLNNRVFFDSRADAAAAGYAPCARLQTGAYDGACFGPAD